MFFVVVGKLHSGNVCVSVFRRKATLEKYIFCYVVGKLRSGNVFLLF